VNPLREELADRLRAAGLPVVSIERLRDLAGTPALPPRRIDDGRAVAVLQYRDGTVIDTIRCSTQAGQA
jgi:citrate lyase subunit alpha / citrate CoA-transferase